MDGFLAHEQDSLGWLFVQDDHGKGFDYDAFINGVGAGDRINDVRLGA